MCLFGIPRAQVRPTSHAFSPLRRFKPKKKPQAALQAFINIVKTRPLSEGYIPSSCSSRPHTYQTRFGEVLHEIAIFFVPQLLALEILATTLPTPLPNGFHPLPALYLLTTTIPISFFTGPQFGSKMLRFFYSRITLEAQQRCLHLCFSSDPAFIIHLHSPIPMDQQTYLQLGLRKIVSARTPMMSLLSI